MSEMYRFRLMIFGTVLFLVSCFFSVRELRYMLWGELVDAKIVEVRAVTETGRYGQTHQRLKVSYQFQDEATQRRESDTVSDSWELERGPTVSVQFIPGSPKTSRLEGHSQRVWLLVFGGSMVGLGIVAVRFSRFYKS